MPNKSTANIRRLVAIGRRMKVSEMFTADLRPAKSLYCPDGCRLQHRPGAADFLERPRLVRREWEHLSLPYRQVPVEHHRVRPGRRLRQVCATAHAFPEQGAIGLRSRL